MLHDVCEDVWLYLTSSALQAEPRDWFSVNIKGALYSLQV